MTLRIFESTYRDLPCWKCEARMAYKKDGKTFYIQKTWRAVSEVFKAKREEVENSFNAQAKRWEAKVIDILERGENPPELKQEEIEV